MTITTEAANETATTTVLVAPFVDLPDFEMGLVRNNIVDDGGIVFLGANGKHGTVFRLTTNREKHLMACILEHMAVNLRAGISMSEKRNEWEARKLQEQTK